MDRTKEKKCIPEILKAYQEVLGAEDVYVEDPEYVLR